MTRLADVVNEETVAELRRLEAAGAFPGISLRVMLEFLMSDGIMPESGLPLSSLLSLEDWARQRLSIERGSQAPPRPASSA
jgi:hypothetical protein